MGQLGRPLPCNGRKNCISNNSFYFDYLKTVQVYNVFNAIRMITLVVRIHSLIVWLEDTSTIALPPAERNTFVKNLCTNTMVNPEFEEAVSISERNKLKVVI